MKTSTRRLVLGLAALTAVRFAQAETLKIDPAHSAAEFQVSNMAVNSVSGRFKVLSGTIDFDVKNPAASKVDVTIQAESIDTANEKRDKHLRNEDFFDVVRFPTLKYKSQTIEKKGDTYVMTGLLTIRDITKTVPVTFTFDATQTGGKTHLKARGTTGIIREEFGITYGNAAMIGHEVKITLVVEAS